MTHADDFTIDGTGSSPNWETANWLDVTPVKGQATWQTRVKLLYSNCGLYCFFDCQSGPLRPSSLSDNDDLWEEDVVELFLWPDESHRVYFEYELSPHGKELPLLISNYGGRFMGWSPWHYVEGRRVQKRVHVRGDHGWSAEIFVPFLLLSGLPNTPPTRGTVWRANFHRIDYGQDTQTLFAWSTGLKNSFHEIEHFGSIHFV